jgi:hypothetical protein
MMDGKNVTENGRGTTRALAWEDSPYPDARSSELQ